MRSAIGTRDVCYPTDIDTGEYKIILQLVGVLSFGKSAKAVTDRAIDMMQDVQNIRKAIYECVNVLQGPGFRDSHTS